MNWIHFATLCAQAILGTLVFCACLSMVMNTHKSASSRYHRRTYSK